MKRCLYYILLFSSFYCTAQEYSTKQLQDLDNEALLSYFSTVENDSTTAEKVARVYLERGRASGDTIMMARGYDRLAQIFHPEKNIAFADSIIALTQDKDHITYPGMGYLLKAFNFYVLDDFNNSNQSNFQGYEQAIKVDNLSQQLYVLDALIFNKVIWGDKKEALELQHKRHKILISEEYKKNFYSATRQGAQKDFNKYYLEQKIESYLSFAICHLYLQQNDSVDHYLNFTKEYFSKRKDEHFLNFMFNEINMENNYYKGEYEKSLIFSDKLFHISNKSNSELMNIFMFKGLSLYDMGEQKEALVYLNKSDSIFNLGINIKAHPSDRLLFDKLKNHYAKKGDRINQIKYLNRQLFLDSLILNKAVGFEREVVRNIEIPKLIAERETIEDNLRNESALVKRAIVFVLIGLLLLLLLLFYILYKQSLYKRRFFELSDKFELEHGVIKISSYKEGLNISQEVLSNILERLENFEATKKYLQQNLSLNTLAKKLDTNPNYLSRVINLKREKNFSQYLNELRINFAILELKENPRFRKYSIKAIAEECGYKNATSFSRAFYKHTGMYPSFYVKQLEKESN